MITIKPESSSKNQHDLNPSESLWDVLVKTWSIRFDSSVINIRNAGHGKVVDRLHDKCLSKPKLNIQNITGHDFIFGQAVWVKFKPLYVVC